MKNPLVTQLKTNSKRLIAPISKQHKRKTLILQNPVFIKLGTGLHSMITTLTRIQRRGLLPKRMS